MSDHHPAIPDQCPHCTTGKVTAEMAAVGYSFEDEPRGYIPTTLSCDNPQCPTNQLHGGPDA